MPYGRRTPSSEFPAFRFPAWLRCLAVFGLLWLNIGWSFGAAHEPARQPSARASRHVEPSTKHTSKAKAKRSSKAKKPTAGKARRRVAHKRKHVASTERTMHVSKITPKHRRQAARNCAGSARREAPAELAAKRDTQHASASRASMPHKGPRLLARCGYTPKSRACFAPDPSTSSTNERKPCLPKSRPTASCQLLRYPN